MVDNADALVLLRKLIDASPDQFEEISSKASRLSTDEKSRIEEIVLEIRDSLGEADANHDLVTNQFRPNNLFSPFNNLLVNSSADSFHEHGLISLGENTWSQKKHEGKPKHALVMVSGVNDLSTSIALRALSEKETFVNRPFGCVLEVRAGNGLGPLRITGADPVWFTRTHSAEELMTKIDSVLENFSARPSAYELLFDTKEELAQYREMVTQYSDSTAVLDD